MSGRAAQLDPGHRSHGGIWLCWSLGNALGGTDDRLGTCLYWRRGAAIAGPVAGGGALLLADDGEATLAVEHFWQFVFLIPAILVALGMFVLQHHVGSFAQLYRRRLDGASYLLVSCGIALVLGKLCVLLLA